MAIVTPVSRKGTAFKQALLDYIFLNVPIPGIGDAGGLLGSTLAGDLYISLHYTWRDQVARSGVYRQDILEYPLTIGAGTLYTGYTRVAVPRDATNWERIGNRVRNKLDITFPIIGGARAIAPYYFLDPAGVGIGVASSGVGVLLYYVPCLIGSPLAEQQSLADGTLTGYPAEAARIAAFNLQVEEV